MPDPAPPPAGQPPSGNERRNRLEQFQNASLEAIHQDELKRAARKELRDEENTRFAAAAAEGVLASDAAEKRKAEEMKKWRAGEKARKAAIEADKKRKAEEQRLIQEKKEKDEKYREQRLKYFASLHEDAARKAEAERKEAERELARKDSIQHAERDALEAKMQAGSEEMMTKERLERAAQERKQEIDKEYADTMDGLHKEEELRKFRIQAERDQKLLPLESQKAKPGYDGQKAGVQREFDARMRALTDEMARKRLEAEEYKAEQRRAVEAETVRLRQAAEMANSSKRRDIDTQLWQEKADVNRQYGKR